MRLSDSHYYSQGCNYKVKEGELAPFPTSEVMRITYENDEGCDVQDAATNAVLERERN